MKNEIQKLLEKGLPTIEIARKLEISNWKVWYWRKKLNLPGEQKTINWAMIQEDINNGLTENEIASKHSISNKSIHRAKQRGEIVHKPKPKLTTKQIQARKNEANARYRARLKAQTPADADIPAMKKFYEDCPDGYEVDHIIPISKGGLHTMKNLQYLTLTENRKKGAKIIGK